MTGAADRPMGVSVTGYRVNPLSFIAHEAFVYQFGREIRSFLLTPEAWGCLRDYYELPSLAPRPRPSVSAYCSTLVERGVLMPTDGVEAFLRRERRPLFVPGHDIIYFLVAAHRAGFPFRFEFEGNNPLLIVEMEGRPRLLATRVAVYDGRSFLGESAGGDHLMQTKPGLQHILERAGYRVPEQVVLSLDELPAEALPLALPPADWVRRFVERHSFRPVRFPLVVKPSNASLGIGVTIARDWEQLASAVLRAKARAGLAATHLVIQRFIGGPEYRATVLGDGSVAACRRTRFTIRGDGRATIEALVERENRRREEIVGRRGYWREPQRLQLDDVKALLDTCGLTAASVLEPGRRLALCAAANAAAAGLVHEANTALTPEAIRWLRGIGELLAVDRVGIDLIGVRLASGRRPLVLEANARSSVALHEEPDYGRSLAWADRILRYFLRKGLSAHTASVLERQLRSSHPDA